MFAKHRSPKCKFIASAMLVAASLTVAVPVGAEDSELTWEEFSYEPYPLARVSEDVGRYTEATPQTLTVSQHGEIEYLGFGVFGTHWFVEADGPVWHFVTAGDPSNEAVLMVHGYPDTWWANAEVMALLSDEYYVVAVDVLGYGQSDKGPEIDVSYAGSAGSLATLLDTIGIAGFNLISHDRGTIVSENLLSMDGMSDRVLAYVRMQQSFDQPHGLPRPSYRSPQGLDQLITQRTLHESSRVRGLQPQQIDQPHVGWLCRGTAPRFTFGGTNRVSRHQRLRNADLFARSPKC
ncbi:MAG: alpha/beta fold hydrolase [Pseudomonadota bacterium]